MESSSEIQELALEYAFKKGMVNNHQSDLVKEGFFEGYKKAALKYTAELKKLSEKEQNQAIQKTEYKQIAYKLQGDLDTLKEQQLEIEDSKMENDIAFLYEMKSRAINAFDNHDVSDKEMLYTMIDDWIHDLRLKRAAAKTEA